jgi:hypothetical protein
VIALPKTPKAALTVKFLKAEAGPISFQKCKGYSFLGKGRGYAMTGGFPAPVEDGCFSLALREGSRTSVYLPKAGNEILRGKRVHFVAIDFRLKIKGK